VSRRATDPATAGNGGLLVAVEGLGERAWAKAAREELGGVPRAARGGVSLWDASGVFGDLVVANDDAGHPSARTLLLLYAADLAFRLRWEIGPVLQKNRCVIAAPYVATALAFGRASRVDEEWLTNLFLFAPVAARTRTIDTAQAASEQAGFVDFVCARLARRPGGPRRRALRDQVRTQLKKTARAARGR
jgi:hypothetical protein